MQRPKSIYACFLPHGSAKRATGAASDALFQPHQYREAGPNANPPLAGAFAVLLQCKIENAAINDPAQMAPRSDLLNSVT
jgi:hypothetical protein